MLKFRFFSFVTVIFLFLLNIFCSKASDYSPKTDQLSSALYFSKINQIKDTVYTVVEEQPIPPFGLSEYRERIAKAINYSQFPSSQNVIGLVQLSFVIGADGRLRDIKVVRDYGFGVGESIVDLIEQSNAKWKPGLINGKAVDVLYNLTIYFDTNQLKTIMEEEEAVPPGGMQAFRQWIANNYVIPDEIIDSGVRGSILISFIVEKDGSLSNIEVLRDIGYGSADAMIKLLKRSKNWKPATMKGQNVRTRFRLPITIDFSD